MAAENTANTTSTTCSYVYSRGSHAGERCSEPAFKHGYCESCIHKLCVVNSLGLKICGKPLSGGCYYQYPILFSPTCQGRVREGDQCDQCLRRTQPKAVTPYPKKLKEIEALYRQDESEVIHLVNMISIRNPVKVDELWSWSESAGIRLLKKEHLQAMYKLKLETITIRIRPGTMALHVAVFYEFQTTDDKTIVFVMLPEQGHVYVDGAIGPNPVIELELTQFPMRDWIKIFGVPKYD